MTSPLPALQDVLEQVADAIPGCLFTSVVDSDSGMSLAMAGGYDELSASSADAYQSELHRAIHRMIDAVMIQEPLETVVLIASGMVFVSIPLQRSAFFWHVVTSVDTTIGFTRAVLRKSQGQVIEAIRPLMI